MPGILILIAFAQMPLINALDNFYIRARSLNNLEKRILQKKREPTILENSRLCFIWSIHEN